MSERPSRYERYQDPLQVYAEADSETRAVIEKELDRIAALDQREVRLNGWRRSDQGLPANRAALRC
jgi:hypothetical protein